MSKKNEKSFLEIASGKTEREAYVNSLRTFRKKSSLEASQKFKKYVIYTKRNYQVKWFHSLITDYLDKLSDREIRRLMIFMPPQHGKTELSSRRFPTYCLGKNPNEKLIIGSYNKTKAEEFVTDCKRIMQSEEYKEVFPNVRLDGKLKADYIEVNGGSGFIKGAGMDSGVTGTSASGIIIDDPFKGRNEANSETARRSIWNTYNDDFLTRLDNDYFILMLFTRWHADDLAGRILDPENQHYSEDEACLWTVLVFQALREEVIPIQQAVPYDDPREIDGALWEEKHARSKYLVRRKNNPTGFASLDQQRPSALEGNKILREWFTIMNESELPFNANQVTTDFFIDGAFTDSTKNDETALLSCYHNPKDGKLYIFSCIGIRKELYEFLPFFKGYASEVGRKANSMVHIEPKASGKPIKSMLSKLEYGFFNTTEIPNSVVSLGKWNRVESTESILASGKVVLVKGSWNQRFIDQCATFPNASHDDMVDVLCYAVFKYFLKNKAQNIEYQN